MRIRYRNKAQRFPGTRVKEGPGMTAIGTLKSQSRAGVHRKQTGGPQEEKNGNGLTDLTTQEIVKRRHLLSNEKCGEIQP